VTFPAQEVVVRLRAPLIADAYAVIDGVPVPSVRDWSAAEELSFDAAVADSGSAEPLVTGRAPVDSDFTVYADAGIDVLSTDRLVIRGLPCDVIGRPFDWRSPFTGWRPGTVIRASVREG
jgi:hypothetical protein